MKIIEHIYKHPTEVLQEHGIPEHVIKDMDIRHNYKHIVEKIKDMNTTDDMLVVYNVPHDYVQGMKNALQRHIPNTTLKYIRSKRVMIIVKD